MVNGRRVPFTPAEVENLRTLGPVDVIAWAICHDDETGDGYTGTDDQAHHIEAALFASGLLTERA